MVVLVLLAAILEMILPSGALQKYVRVVLGLVMVLAMLLPIRALFVGVFSGAWEKALAGPLISNIGVSSAASAGATTYSQSVQRIIALSLSQGLPQGSLTVQVATRPEADGSVSVNGVYITCQNVFGYVFHRQEALALQAQTAELLGLSASAIHVSYPGGEV